MALLQLGIDHYRLCSLRHIVLLETAFHLSINRNGGPRMFLADQSQPSFALLVGAVHTSSTLRADVVGYLCNAARHSLTRAATRSATAHTRSPTIGRRRPKATTMS